MYFRVNLDRRKASWKPQHVADVIEEVIASDATRSHPRFLKDIRVDLNSIRFWGELWGP